MKGSRDHEAMVREWARLSSVEAKVIEVRRCSCKRGCHKARVRSALGREQVGHGLTISRALERARRALGYELVRGRVVYQLEAIA